MLALLLLAACHTEPPAPPPPPQAPPPPPQAVDTGPAPTPNQPPRIQSVHLSPDAPTTRDEVSAQVQTTDPDGDPVDVDLQWKINDELLLNRRASTLPAMEFKKGDKVSVVVTASDGQAEVSHESDAITIANASPFFLSDPRSLTRIDGYQVRAEDPDGDDLTYKLQGAPRGMSIDRARGILHYEGAEDEPGGDYHIRVVAEDTDGANVQWEFGIQVTPGSVAAKKAREAKKARDAKEAQSE